LSWLLPELKLRTTVQSIDPGETFGTPQHRTSLDEIQLALERFSARENREELYQTLAHRAGVDLPPRSVWLLYRLADQHATTVRGVAEHLKVDHEIIRSGVEGLMEAGMVQVVATAEPRDVALTALGQDALERLTEARRSGLTELLEGWNPEEHPEVVDMVKGLAASLLADDKRLVADAIPRPRPPVGAAN
jgi:DNA-binding MarR family transcriptional regulator